jgi:hypothetical protein
MIWTQTSLSIKKLVVTILIIKIWAPRTTLLSYPLVTQPYSTHQTCLSTVPTGHTLIKRKYSASSMKARLFTQI